MCLLMLSSFPVVGEQGERVLLTGDCVVEDVAVTLAAFAIQNEDVKVRDKRLLALYIGVKLELL